MSPSEFAAKWSASHVKETAGSKEHFADLCRLLGVQTPIEADPDATWYAYEHGASKTDGRDGFADVWKRGHFGWEYKGPRKDLAAAYRQLLDYREALENPPLLVVSDMDQILIHTNFTNTAKVVHRVTLEQLATDPAEPLRLLRAVFLNPDALRPSVTREEITAAAARDFAALAVSIRERGHDPQATAHFLNKLLFSLFAEDAGLLPTGLLARLLSAARDDPAVFSRGLAELFARMSHEGGLFGTDVIAWFNGGLFDGPEVIELTGEELKTLAGVARLDWSNVEPAIFGTLFERGLDPDKRSQLGAHYTDRAAIERLVSPVVVEPLRREFETMQARVLEIGPHRYFPPNTKPENHPLRVFQAYLARLRSVTVLDPACGSGNFLYVALQALKDLEREALLWGSEVLRVPIGRPEIGPEALRGIELNTYAAEIARVVIWIGEIQWMLDRGFGYRTRPILRALDAIECRDALLASDAEGNPREADWPDATFIVGNPPFLGNRLLRRGLGSAYVDRLHAVYGDRLPASSDLVCYWHEKARALLESGRVERVGLLATQGIRGQANRRVLERIKASGDIFMAWSDEPWVLDGAAVNVSFLAYDDGSEPTKTLNGHVVDDINPDLTSGVDLTRARRLRENRGRAFMGDIKVGPFEVPGELARSWLELPNPHGRPNRDVLRPWANGLDVTRRPRDMWIIDFGLDMPLSEAQLYEAPFAWVEQHVAPMRARVNAACCQQRWWIHHNRRPEMSAALEPLSRYLATSAVAKHRLWAWLPGEVLPDHALIVVAADDDLTFGLLSSRFHVAWSRRAGTQLESRPRYTPTSCFETFPFPRPSDGQRQAIAALAAELDARRRAWLDPPGLEPEQLEARTLTALYNEAPAWLRGLHERLDSSVAAAYGWAADIDDDTALANLLELNLARAGTS